MVYCRRLTPFLSAAQTANPFVFKHVQHASSLRNIDMSRACVVMATPSMLQAPSVSSPARFIQLLSKGTTTYHCHIPPCSGRRLRFLSAQEGIKIVRICGLQCLTNSELQQAVGALALDLTQTILLQSGLSREVFDAWCQDPRNCVIIADFAVQGTLAREILGSPDHVITRSGARVRFPQCSVHSNLNSDPLYISFLHKSETAARCCCCAWIQAYKDALKFTHCVRFLGP